MPNEKIIQLLESIIATSKESVDVLACEDLINVNIKVSKKDALKNFIERRFKSATNQYERDYLLNDIVTENSYYKHINPMREDANIIDVGCNVGVFSILTRALYPNAKIWAFEPAKSTYESALKNLSTENVFLYDVAVGSEVGSCQFKSFNNYSLMSGVENKIKNEKVLKDIVELSMSENKEKGIGRDLLEKYVQHQLGYSSYEVDLTTLACICQEQDIKRIDLLKIDVQGSEFDVIKGIDFDTIDYIGQIMIEVEESINELSRIRKYLTDYGFNIAAVENCGHQKSLIHVIHKDFFHSSQDDHFLNFTNALTEKIAQIVPERLINLTFVNP